MVEEPAQIGFAEAEIDTEGLGVTVTTDCAVPEQDPVVPVTVYVVVAPGLTVFGFPEPRPPLQLYVVAPAAVNVAVVPAQIEGLFTVTLGVAFTVTTDVAVPVHPPVVPVTV